MQMLYKLFKPILPKKCIKNVHYSYSIIKTYICIGGRGCPHNIGEIIVSNKWCEKLIAYVHTSSKLQQSHNYVILFNLYHQPFIINYHLKFHLFTFYKTSMINNHT